MVCWHVFFLVFRGTFKNVKKRGFWQDQPLLGSTFFLLVFFVVFCCFVVFIFCSFWKSQKRPFSCKFRVIWSFLCQNPFLQMLLFLFFLSSFFFLFFFFFFFFLSFPLSNFHLLSFPSYSSISFETHFISIFLSSFASPFLFLNLSFWVPSWNIPFFKSLLSLFWFFFVILFFASCCCSFEEPFDMSKLRVATNVFLRPCFKSVKS